MMKHEVGGIRRARWKYWFVPLIPIVGMLVLALIWATVFVEIAANERMTAGVHSSEEVLAELADDRGVLLGLAWAATLVTLPFIGLLTWIVRRLRAKTAQLRAQREFLRELLDNIPIGISVRRLQHDDSGTYVVWNDTNAVMYGVDKETVLEQPLTAGIAPRETVEQVLQWDADLMASPAVQETLAHHRLRGSGDRLIHRVRAPIFDADDNVAFVVTVSEDITQKRAAEDDLRLASKVFETTADGIIISDRDDRVIRVNPAFTRLTGFAHDEMGGLRVYDSPFGPPDREEAERRLERLRREGCVTAQIQRRHRDGHILDLWLTATSVRNAEGEIVNFVRVFSDIAQIRSTQVQLEQLANFDPLTGLANRRLFADRIEQAIALGQRRGAKVGLLFLDLDGFKEINDSCGHEVGDAVLKVVAQRLKDCVRASDSICRLGGDEFTVILGDAGTREGAVTVAQSIMKELRRPIAVGARTLRVGASIGIALYPDDGQLSVELINRADAAMYRAKNEGGNRHAFFGEAAPALQKVA